MAWRVLTLFFFTIAVRQLRPITTLSSWLAWFKPFRTPLIKTGDKNGGTRACMNGLWWWTSFHVSKDAKSRPRGVYSYLRGPFRSVFHGYYSRPLSGKALEQSKRFQKRRVRLHVCFQLTSQQPFMQTFGQHTKHCLVPDVWSTTKLVMSFRMKSL